MVENRLVVRLGSRRQQHLLKVESARVEVRQLVHVEVPEPQRAAARRRQPRSGRSPSVLVIPPARAAGVEPDAKVGVGLHGCIRHAVSRRRERLDAVKPEHGLEHADAFGLFPQGPMVGQVGVGDVGVLADRRVTTMIERLRADHMRLKRLYDVGAAEFLNTLG